MFKASAILLPLTGFLFFSPSIQAEDNPVLKFGFGTYQSPPYVHVDNNTLTGGVMHDIGHALAQQLGSALKFVSVPKKRLENFLETGRIDIRCHISKHWLENPDRLFWSTDIYSLETVSAVPAIQASQIKTPADLAGRKIGTVLGYKYDKTILDLFERKKAVRVDGASIETNIQNLLRYRIDTVIGTRPLLTYLLATKDTKKEFAIAPYVIRKQNLGCAISPKSVIAPDRLKAAIRTLVEKEVLQEIIDLRKRDT